MLLVAPTVAAAQGGVDLGEVDFPNSGAEAAQEPFRRGLLLLHNFEYPDARSAFEEARRRDPGFALAYWGEALTYDHPLWGEENLDAARAALRELAETREARLARAPTARERGYLRAVHELFGDGDKPERDRRYAAAMRELAERYPEDDDAAALYALALLGTAEEGRDPGIYMQAAAVLEELVDRSPRHPGALHYMIHAYDDPVHAPLGLRAARAYSTVAADAVHALHMPSHIFFALGMWEEAIRMNEASWQASVERARRLDSGPASWSYHALWWLHYAYLQERRLDDARRLLAIAEEALEESGAGTIRYHLAQMRAAHVVADPTAGDLVEDALVGEGMGGRARAANLLAAGLALLSDGRPDAARGAWRELERVGRADPEPAVRAMEMQMRGARLLHSGERREGLALLREAAELEWSIPYVFGPPLVVKPGYELLGEALLAAGDRTAAAAAFRKALERAPGRTLSVEGVARATGETADGGVRR
ncbi:MAG: tetratricopeptide repeat protein [Gemmatimonadota bacterium]